MIKHFNKKIMLLFIFLFSLSLLGCNAKDKSITLSTNVEEDMKVTENSILETMNLGANALKEQNFTDAKSYFEKATSYDKTRVQTYLDIKDKYLEINRLDDAYYFIRLAIDNKVDVDNMKILKDEIKSKFNITTINESVSINSNYTLPNEVDILINNEKTKTKVTWKNTNVSTSSLGNFNFNGISDEYDREVNLVLTVKEVKKEKICGYIRKLYSNSNTDHILFDDCEIFISTPEDHIARREAEKDGLIGTFDDGGYVRNKDTSTKEYIISTSCTFKLCKYLVPRYNDSSSIVDVDYSFFKNILKQFPNTLFWIYTEDNIITSFEMQFQP
ncbi:Ig-like domain-containing protein [Clostridium paraputrificum]|uniref:Ig-like domain-containing protein n=1 Tax=Clostridium paraputrificum TaxID=29363 RepID=UPI00374F5DE4